MAPMWEVWGLGALGLFEFAVAYWWWNGPHLKPTRGWVTALFLLGGISTFRFAVVGVPGLESAVIDGVGRLADRTSNLCLLAFAVLALGLKESGLPRLLLGVVGLGFVISLPFSASEIFGGGQAPAWAGFLLNLPLWLAILIASAALIQLTRRRNRAEAGLWLLALSSIGFRFAELVAWLAPARVESLMTGPGGVALLEILLELAGLPAMVVAFSWLLWKRARNGAPHLGEFYDVSLVLLLAGFLFGFARATSAGTSLALLFSLAFVRPTVFLVVQWQLESKPFRDTDQWKQLRTGGSAVVASLLGIPLGAMFGMGTGGSVLVGFMLAAISLAAIATIRRTDSPIEGSRPREPDIFDALALDSENVALPEDWTQRAARGFESYNELPVELQAKLEGLSRWQRIVLTLHAVPEGNRLPSYERTTPGLHFLTHTPYPSIGSEISRTNERWAEILKELGMSRPSTGNPEEPLIRSRTGPAHGLSSPRAKSYELTSLGEHVAEGLVEAVGLAELPQERLVHVIGEGYGKLANHRVGDRPDG